MSDAQRPGPPPGFPLNPEEAAHRAEAGRCRDEAMRTRNPFRSARLHARADRHVAAARKLREA